MTREQILAVAKPILFNTEMVQALLDDRKHVTRRVVKLDFRKIYGCACAAGKWHESYGNTLAEIPPQIIERYVMEKAKLPYRPGDLLYVRETWNGDWCDHYIYKADGGSAKAAGYGEEPKWRPSIHMPKEAARIFLRVTDVRVERLHDMTADSAMDEGFTDWNDVVRVWNSTIPKKDLPLYGWSADPWVWAIEFERVVAE